MLQDIRQRAAALIAERNRLNEEKRRLVDQREALKTRVTEQDSCDWLNNNPNWPNCAPQPQPTPVPSADPVVGERIRALVEEIDACIALMPHTRDMAAVELLSA